MDATMFDATTLDFGTPSKLGSTQQTIVPFTAEKGGRFDWNTRVKLQFGSGKDAMLHTQYGVSTPLPGQDPNRRNLDVAITPDIEGMLKRFDAVIIDYCTKHCDEIFKSKTLQKQYVPLLHDREDEGKGKFVRFKVICGGEKSKPTEVIVLNDEMTKSSKRDHTSVTRDSSVAIMADTPGIWFNATQFGVSLTARSIVAKPPANKTGLAVFSGFQGVEDEPTEATDGFDEA